MASSAEVAQPTSNHHPIPGSVPNASNVESLKPAWGGAGIYHEAAGMLSPLGGAVSKASSQIQPSPASFRDVMSEDLAKDLDKRDNETYLTGLVEDPLELGSLLGRQKDTSDDLILAQMLQYEFDREYDQQVNREEKLYNGNSKVSVSFNKFKICPSWYGPDSDDELQDIDDEGRAIDSFEERQLKDPVIPPRGYVKQGSQIVTKHDLNIAGRKNAERFMNLPPGINTGDGGGFDMHLSNKVYNKLCHSAMSDMRRKHRVHDKVEKATTEMALDPKTRLLLFKLVNNAVLDSVNGIVSSGKEAVVFHAQGGELNEQPLPEDCAVKVFKTTLTDFKTRERYIKDDYRFKDRLSKNNARKLIQLWAEKEYHNLRRLQKAQIPAPNPILIKKHVLLMSFIGANHQAAPKLKEACLSLADLCIAYEQVVETMVKMFHGCHLVHADLSEYNILWYEGQCWIIDLGQAVEPSHPHALHFLHRDCTNIVKFFKSKGLPNLPSPLQLFKKVSGISLRGPEESAPRMIEEYESQQELLRDDVKNMGDRFEFLWEEIQADERHRKDQKAAFEEEEEEEDFEELMDESDKDERLKTDSSADDLDDDNGISNQAEEECTAGSEGESTKVHNATTLCSTPGAKINEKNSRKKRGKNKKNK